MFIKSVLDICKTLEGLSSIEGVINDRVIACV